MLVCVRMISYSQQGEDICILKNFINKRAQGGIFVEVGALDGVTYSNTKFLEDELGFGGILIEPSRQYENLVKNRPSCVCIDKAVAEHPGMIRFVGQWATAGMVDTMSSSFRRYHFEPTDVEYEVEATTLKTILRDNRIEYIDFMSVDVEGGELSVLRSMDWDIPVYVIVVELDGHNPTKDMTCRKILVQHNFEFFMKLGNNEIYHDPSYHRKNKLFDKSISFPETVHLAFAEHHLMSEIRALV